MRAVVDIALILLLVALIFALGFVVGAGEALRLKEREAIDEGFAVREALAGRSSGSRRGGIRRSAK
jgi:hypothetical protein